MSVCADCRRYRAEVVRLGLRSRPFNCSTYKIIVSPGQKACAAGFTPRVRKPKDDEQERLL